MLAEMSNGDWDAKHGQSYLQSLAVTTLDAKKMVEEGKTQNNKQKASSLYKIKDVIPPIWLMGYDMVDFIDCAKHHEWHSQMN